MMASDCSRRFVVAAAGTLLVIPAATLSALARAATAASPAPSSVAGIALPTTDLALQARELARTACPPYLFNHCMRTFVFGALAAKKRNIAYDAEALFVAAALHDLGLIERYQSANAPFELDSADAAKSFLRDHGVEGPRAELIWDAIAMHALAIAGRKAPEVRLLAFGAGTDVFGGGIQLLGDDVATEAVASFPRDHFNTQFGQLLLDYCKRKPGAQAGTWTDAFCRSHLPATHFPTFEEAFAHSPFKE